MTTITLYACISAPITETTKYLEITGLKFRKTGSINTDILWAGVARITGPNTFDPKFFPILEQEISARKVTEAFNEQTAKAAYEATAKAKIEIAEGTISGNVSSEETARGTYHVFKIFNVNDLVKELNSEANRENLESLMRYKDPRIITSIAVVFGHRVNETINRSGNIELSIKNPKIGSPELSLKHTSTGQTIAKLSDGTVFAYEYSRFCWEKKDGRIGLAALEVDRPGWDNDCPSGTKDDASKL